MKEIQRLNKKGFPGEREAWRQAREMQKQHNDKHIGHSPNEDGTFCIAEFPMLELDNNDVCAYVANINMREIAKKMNAIIKRLNKLNLNSADKAMFEETERIYELINTAYFDTDYFNTY